MTFAKDAATWIGRDRAAIRNRDAGVTGVDWSGLVDRTVSKESGNDGTQLYNLRGAKVKHTLRPTFQTEDRVAGQK